MIEIYDEWVLIERGKVYIVTPNKFEESCIIYDRISKMAVVKVIEMACYASDLDGSLFLLESLNQKLAVGPHPSPCKQLIAQIDLHAQIPQKKPFGFHKHLNPLAEKHGAQVDDQQSYSHQGIHSRPVAAVPVSKQRACSDRDT